MTILALEFSSHQRSAAVVRANAVVSEAVQAGDRGAAALTLIEQVLAAAQIQREEIQAISIGLGPGSYTGVRAAIALAQGWQLARGTPTIGIGSVPAIAAQARAEMIFGRVNVVIDAQRRDFYAATYEISEGGPAETAALKILPAAELQTRAARGEIFIGPEAAKYFATGRNIFPRAAVLATLAAGRTGFLPAEKLEPVYLRQTSFVKAGLKHSSHGAITAR